jgi:hypothetical protein
VGCWGKLCHRAGGLSQAVEMLPLQLSKHPRQLTITITITDIAATGEHAFSACP